MATTLETLPPSPPSPHHAVKRDHQQLVVHSNSGNNELAQLDPDSIEAKRAKCELEAYVAKRNRQQSRTSSLFAPIVLLTGHESEIFNCKFSPCGQVLASAGFDRKIMLWNVYGECENWVTLTGHTGAILDMKWNSTGDYLLTGGTDKSVCLWDVQTCTRLKKFKGHQQFVNSVDVARDEKQNIICSSSDDQTVKVWDRRKKNEVMSFQSPYQVLACTFNESAEMIVSAGVDNVLKMWDMRKPSSSSSSKGGKGDMDTGEDDKVAVVTIRGHTDTVTGLRLSPDGNYVASNSMDNTIRIWDIRPFVTQDRCVNVLHGHSHNFEKNLLKVAWSPDGQLITAGSADKFVYVWDLASSKIEFKLPGHIGSVNDVDFHPDEPIVASGSSDKKIYLGEL